MVSGANKTEEEGGQIMNGDSELADNLELMVLLGIA